MVVVEKLNVMIYTLGLLTRLSILKRQVIDCCRNQNEISQVVESASGGTNAVQSMEKLFQPPQLQADSLK